MFGLFLLMVEFVLVILNNKESGRFAQKTKNRIQRLETSIPNHSSRQIPAKQSTTTSKLHDF
jgi:hypothetical protein